MAEEAPPTEPRSSMASIRRVLLSGGPWPIVAVLVAGLASFVAIVLWAPEGTREFLFGAHGLFFTLLAWVTSSPLKD